MKVAVIGAGRIGRVHIENISTGVREMEIKTVADPFLNADSEAFIKSFGIPNHNDNRVFGYRACILGRKIQRNKIRH